MADESDLLGSLKLPDPPPRVAFQEPHIKRRCYACRYRLRWVPSKGASLVLVWTLLVSISFGSLDSLFTKFLQIFSRHDGNFLPSMNFLPYIPWFLFALLSGWVADSRFGNYSMVKIGFVVSFLASILASVLQLTVGEYIDELHLFVYIVYTLIHCLGFAGRAMILVTSVQLGLDQMPEANSANVTSFIAWFVACLYAGNWINLIFSRVLATCWTLDHVNSSQIFSLVSAVPLAIVLSSDSLLTKRWLITDIKCPQSSKIIYQVLKFAKKHTAPLNRSALTYWEEDIPPRIDFGKSKYGGPFSTEQVEDVKTVFRMIALSLSFGFVFTSFYLFQQFAYSAGDASSTLLGNQTCVPLMMRSFTYETSLWVVGGIAVYEFAIYPFAMPIIPSSLKRIGATSFLTIVVNGLSLLFIVVVYFNKSEVTGMNNRWFWIVQSLISAPLKIILLTSAIEFVCAQSPYNMKGLMIGYMWSEYYMSNIIANFLAGILHTLCQLKLTVYACSIIYSSGATFLSIIGFLLFCVLARWYKRRVRDDIATPHRWAEEAYDRYLDQEERSAP